MSLVAVLSLLGLAAAPAATLAISALLGWVSMQISGQILEWDVQLFRLVNGWSRPEITRLILLLLNDPGIDYVAIITPCLIYVWLKRLRDTPGAILALTAALVLGSLTIQFTQQFGLRERPFVRILDANIDEEWRKIWLLFPTFPSGHLRETVGLAMVLGYFWPASRWPAAIYSFIVAFTRLYLGAHYPTDIAAGAFIGALDGFTALFIVNRLGWLLGLARNINWLRSLYTYLVVPGVPGGWSQDPVLARILRLILLLGALIGGSFLGGLAINFSGLRIIYDLMRNFDNSVAHPLLLRFDASNAGVVYQAFGNGQYIYPALGVLIMLLAIAKGWRELARAILVILLSVILIVSIATVLGIRFDRPLPYSELTNQLTPEWRLAWASPAAFPQQHVMMVAALSTALGYFSRPLLPVAYAYPLAVAGALLYFGAAWPMDIVVSLLVGQGVARYAIFFGLNIMRASDQKPGRV